MRENDSFVTENCIRKIEFGCNRVVIFGVVPKVNLTGTTFFCDINFKFGT